MTRCTAPLRTLSYDLSRDDGLRTRVLALDGDPGWSVENAGPVFTVVVDGVTITGTSPGLRVEGVTSVRRDDGVVDETTRCRYEEHAADAGDGEYAGDVGAAADGLAVGIDWHVRRYPDLPLVETWVSVTNQGRRAVTVERLDSVGLTIPAGRYELLSYTSAWGREFDGDREPLTAGRSIGTLAGRSSHGMHPWLGLVRDDGAVLCGAVAWSGNWVVRFEEAPETAKPSATEETSEGWKPNEGHNEGYIVTGGLHDQGFAKRLRPGETVDAPPVVLALGSDGDLDTTSIALARAARAYWAPRNALAERLPVEWNHWWTYEDHSVDAATFRANVDVAAELGVEVVTLDAGWFGPADASSAWTDVRGDWDQVNTARFPEGIRALADHAHARGLRFGLWCEIEALGPKATLASRRPDFPATRDGEPLGYVCLANPAAWQWAFETLDRLVREFGTDWIKLDFNLDPGLGCDRTDHGHGPGDGLFEHYRGYYRLLDRIRETHPHVVLENCSSGGLRIDLGIMRHTHLTFLSDPDWPEHGLQLLWGATTMLPPNQLLHWGFSEWHGHHPHQTFDPRDPGLRPHQLDFYRRIAMLGATGFSCGLPNLPAWVRDRLRAQVRAYQELVRPFVRTADVHRLTGAPRRFGEGERWAAVQYAQPDGGAHLVFVFRLPGGEPSRRIRLHALDPTASYDVHWSDRDHDEARMGAALMDDGLTVELPEEGSELVVVRRRSA